jgi:DNA-binding XRE family transcriptional regulator
VSQAPKKEIPEMANTRTEAYNRLPGWKAVKAIGAPMPFSGEKLQKLREQVGLSQLELAERTGLPIGSIRNWEQGRTSPRMDAVYVLAQALGTSMENLIDVKPPKKKGK